MTQRHGKAAYDSWHTAAMALKMRLETIASVYQEHGYPAQSARVSTFCDHIQQNFSILAAPIQGESETVQGNARQSGTNLPDIDPGEMLKLEELAIWHAARIFTEMLEIFPLVSSDMQILLGCHWREPVGRRATDLFKGPLDTINLGICSGYVVDGGLPARLFELIRAEKSGSTRPPRHRRSRLYVGETDGRIAMQRRVASKISLDLLPPWHRF